MTCSACSGDRDSTTAYCGQCGERLVARASASRVAGRVLDDRYRIESKIAAGGFGTIYRAVALDDGEPVAIKVLHAQHTTDPSVSARFRREALAMSSLRDPHTVTTYELGEDPDGTRFIVMELLEGESLADRIAAAGVLPWRSVLAIVRQVCSSLAEAHALGIVHRDLKPANIFLASRPQPDFVKVLDFGIAKLVHGSTMHDGSEITRIGQAVGTVEYMSPEQIVGGELDQRTDLYTLGVVAYELITGRRPFADVTGATGLVTALMTRRPPPPSTVSHGPLPPALDGVLLRCLEREPDDRYAHVGELAAALDRMLAVQADTVTTQQMWLGRPASEPGLDPDEHTLIDVRPVFDDLEPADGLVLQQLAVVDLTPRVARLEDVVRAQVVDDALAPRAWRAAGTGAPNTAGDDDLGFDTTQTATPRSLMAVGSSPIITEPAGAAPGRGLGRIVVTAILLAGVGVGLGAALGALLL